MQQRWREEPGKWEFPKGSCFPAGFPDRTLVGVLQADPAEPWKVGPQHHRYRGLLAWPSRSGAATNTSECPGGANHCARSSGRCFMSASPGLTRKERSLPSESHVHEASGRREPCAVSPADAVLTKTQLLFSDPGRRVLERRTSWHCSLTMLCPHNTHTARTPLSATLVLRKVPSTPAPHGSAHRLPVQPCERRLVL